jgi:hypothetical protein
MDQAPRSLDGAADSSEAFAGTSIGGRNYLGAKNHTLLQQMHNRLSATRFDPEQRSKARIDGVGLRIHKTHSVEMADRSAVIKRGSKLDEGVSVQHCCAGESFRRGSLKKNIGEHTHKKTNDGHIASHNQRTHPCAH